MVIVGRTAADAAVRWLETTHDRGVSLASRLRYDSSRLRYDSSRLRYDSSRLRYDSSRRQALQVRDATAAARRLMKIW